MKREVSETKIFVEKVHEVLEGLSNQINKGLINKVIPFVEGREGIGYKGSQEDDKSIEELREVRDREL